MPKKTFTIYLNDDFDGISSAAVFLYFINKTQPDEYKFKYELLVYKPGYKKWWTGKELSEDSAVFDFRYHRKAGWWFDHHETSFFTKTDRRHFEKTKCATPKCATPGVTPGVACTKGWDPKAKSCCGVVLRHLSRKFSFKFPKHLTGLVGEADIIDSYDFKSPAEPAIAERKPILLDKTMMLGASKKYAGILIRGLSRYPISSLFKIPEVKSRTRKIKDLIGSGLKEAKRKTHVVGKAGILFTKNPAVHHASVYFTCPEALYSVIVSREGDFYHIGVGVNKWHSHKGHKNVAEILKEFGGGGHAKAGATQAKTKKEALQIADKLVEILNG